MLLSLRFKRKDILLILKTNKTNEYEKVDKEVQGCS